MIQPGFTQLGRRLTGLERREAKLEARLSVVVVAAPEEEFSLHSISGSFELLRENGLAGEVILVDRESPRGRLEQLIRDFPDLKILIPTGPVTVLEAIRLGAGEAVAQHLLCLRASSRPGSTDLRRQLAFFDDHRLFASGFLPEKDGMAVIPRFEQGRVLLELRTPERAAPVLYLPGFCGMYDREKLLKLLLPSRVLPQPWGDLDFFYGAWSRGWISMVDPESRFSGPESCGCLVEPSGFRKRVRYFRGEIGFLRRNLVDGMHRRLRRRFFFRYSLRRLLRFDFAPALACIAERLRGVFSPAKRERRLEAVFSATEIFTLIREGM